MNQSSLNSSITQETLAKVNWYKVACKIRDQNRELKREISQLSELLSTHKQQLNQQTIELEKQETLIEQQEQKIDNLNAKLNSQSQQQELNIPNDQQLQLVIESLTQQLQKVQQQAARLERECSFLQDKYNQQEHLLQQREKENKELQTRLQRQQRYNLQYKSALDQYLQSHPETEKNGHSSLSNLPENQSIQPWSKPENNSNNSKNFDKVSAKIVHNLSEIVVDKKGKNKDENKEEDIPELIYDETPDSTEAKIDSLISEIEQEMESIMQKKNDDSSSQINEKKLDLPQINQQNGESSSRDKVKKAQSRKFLNLPNLGNKK